MSDHSHEGMAAYSSFEALKQHLIGSHWNELVEMNEDHDFTNENNPRLLQLHEYFHGGAKLPPRRGTLSRKPRSEAEEAYRMIDEEIIPEAIRFFQEKRSDYAGGPAFLLLGSKGQFSDINRKFWKLYASVWEGRELSGEQAEEIVQDFIGHCFLMLYTLREEKE